MVKCPSLWECDGESLSLPCPAVRRLACGWPTPGSIARCSPKLCPVPTPFAVATGLGAAPPYYWRSRRPRRTVGRKRGNRSPTSRPTNRQHSQRLRARRQRTERMTRAPRREAAADGPKSGPARFRSDLLPSASHRDDAPGGEGCANRGFAVASRPLRFDFCGPTWWLQQKKRDSRSR